MNLSRLLLLVAILAVSGCATVSVSESTPPRAGIDPTTSIASSRGLPTNEFLPEQSAVAPGTNYVFIQAEGGSILLGGFLGSMNIAATTKAMAERYKDSLLRVDPASVAIDAMLKAGIRSDSGNAALVVKPFVFVQHCYDERFRLSLVFHVQGSSQADQWKGRYTYHLPTSFPVSEFTHLSRTQIATYQAELTEGATVLIGLLKRDLAGEIPTIGRRVNFGSLCLMGSKFGGLGFYTMPEKGYFQNAQVVEETADYVTVRLKGRMHGTVLGGGLAFGLHRISKNLVHTLAPS